MLAMNGLKNPAFVLTSVITLVGLILLLVQSRSLFGVLFLAPFSLGPLLVSIAFALICRTRPSQVTLSIGSILYGVWFGYVYLSAFHWHPDAQSAIALLFIGFYSLPLMVPIWAVSYVFRFPSGKIGEDQTDLDA
jgi:hypothetical protein